MASILACAVPFLLLLPLLSCERRVRQPVREEKAEPASFSPAQKVSKDKLEQKVSLSFRNEPLGGALRSITVLTGVNISVHPGLMSPKELEEKRLTLDVADVSLRHALDWLVRQFGGSYQVNPDGCIWMTKGYEVTDRPGTDAVFIPNLYNEKDGSDLITILEEAIRPVMRRSKDVLLAVRPRRSLLVVQGPFPARARIKEIAKVLGETDLPVPVPPREDLSGVLGRKILCRYRLISVAELAIRVREKTGLNIGYREDLVTRGRVRVQVNMAVGYIRVKDVLDKLVLRAGFTEWKPEAGKRVWLYGPGEEEYPVSGEGPWFGTIARAYPAGKIVRRTGAKGLETVVMKICRKGAPYTFVRYSEAAGKLLVIAEPRSMADVEEYIRLSRLLPEKPVEKK